MHPLVQQGVTHGQPITAQVRRGGADEHIRQLFITWLFVGESWE